jgi:hypothetical protein
MASFLRWMQDARGRRGMFCLPLALIHHGDKYKSWSSCVEREFIFFLWVVFVFQAN